MSRVICCSLSLVLFLNIAGQAKAEYTLTTLNVPAFDTEPSGINNAGQIVGTSINRAGGHGVEGFLLSGGVSTPLDVPGATYTEASGINDAGQIVGTYSDAKGDYHGFLLSGGVSTPLDVPGASYTVASGINNAGQIVGTYGDGLRQHGFLLSGGVYTTLNVPGVSHTTGLGIRAINDAGQIVGTYSDVLNGTFSFLLSGGVFTKIAVPDAKFTVANGINDAGQIVGSNFNDSTILHEGTGFLASPVPEPATLTLFGLSILGVLGYARCRQCWAPH